MSTYQYLKDMDTMLARHNATGGMSSFYGFFLKYGKPNTVTPSSFPKGGRMKECFKNALHLAQLQPNLRYCEGFADGVIPVHHAWCVDSSGNVFDPTWRSGKDYYGVAFKLSAVLSAVLRRKAYGSIVDDWEAGFPILSGKVDPTDVLFPDDKKKEE